MFTKCQLNQLNIRPAGRQQQQHHKFNQRENILYFYDIKEKRLNAAVTAASVACLPVSDPFARS